MKKTVIIIISTIVFILLASVGALVYFAKSISEEDIQKYAKLGIAKVLPNSTIVIGKSKVSVGTKLYLDVQNVKLTTANGKKLLNVKNVAIDVPLWAILTKGGTVGVKLIEPKVHYVESKRGSNWESAGKSTIKKMAKVKQESKVTSEKKSTKEAVDSKYFSVPAFAANVTLNLLLENLEVDYSLRNKKKGAIKINRFLVKNFGLTSSAAYELKSKLKFGLDDKSNISSEVLAIGEFNLLELLSSNSLSGTSVIKIINTSIDGSKFKIPNVKIDLQTKLDLQGNINGSTKISFDNSSLATSFDLSKKVVTISGLTSNIRISDLLTIYNQPINEVNAGKSAIVLTGKVELKKSKIYPKLQVKLSRPIESSFSDINSKLSLNGSYDGKTIRINPVASLFDGTISIKSSGPLDINSPVLDFTKMKPFLTQITVANLNVEDKVIRDLIYKKRAVSEETTVVSKDSKEKGSVKKDVKVSKKKSAVKVVLPKGRVDLNIVNVKVGENDLSGDGKIIIKNSSVDSKKILLKYNSGTATLKFNTKIQKSINNNFTLNLNNFNMRGLKPFLPTFVKSVSGYFTGRTAGNISLNGDMVRYGIKSKLTARDGAIKGLELDEHLTKALSSLSFLKDKKDKLSPDYFTNFDKLDIIASADNKLITVSKINFKGIKSKISFHGKGKISQPPMKKKSNFYLSLTEKGKLGKELKRATGSAALPLKFTGIDFDLTPDVEYTTNHIAKNASNKAVKKGAEELNKYLKKNGKKDVKKLLKAFGL